MKVEGSSNKVTKLQITHRGMNVHFVCLQQPAPENPIKDIEMPAECKLEFDDIREIDYLIHMLEKAKQGILYGLGVWRTE